MNSASAAWSAGAGVEQESEACELIWALVLGTGTRDWNRTGGETKAWERQGKLQKGQPGGVKPWRDSVL